MLTLSFCLSVAHIIMVQPSSPLPCSRRAAAWDGFSVFRPVLSLSRCPVFHSSSHPRPPVLSELLSSALPSAAIAAIVWSDIATKDHHRDAWARREKEWRRRRRRAIAINERLIEIWKHERGWRLPDEMSSSLCRNHFYVERGAPMPTPSIPRAAFCRHILLRRYNARHTRYLLTWHAERKIHAGRDDEDAAAMRIRHVAPYHHYYLCWRAHRRPILPLMTPRHHATPRRHIHMYMYA